MKNDIDPADLETYIGDEFDKNILPSFKEFLSVPNISPSYDKDWNKNGFLKQAATVLLEYAQNIGISGLNASLCTGEEENVTPFLYIDIDSTSKDEKRVLLYGHYDKQPPLTGWEQGKGPYSPIVEDDYLYGRGAADDGCSFYAALTSIKALQKFKIPHPKIIILIEGCEESGSIDLPFYIEKYKKFIGSPDLIVAMDGGGLDYNRFWLSNSVRGIMCFEITVTTLTKGIHSGKGSGVAPETMMILRNLISRIEDYKSEIVSLKQFEVEIPQPVIDSAKKALDAVGNTWIKNIPILPGVKYLSDDLLKIYLNSSWTPSLAVLGVKGLPDLNSAGNVLRPSTTFKISIRLPPTYEAIKAKQIIQTVMTENPPFNSDIKISNFNYSDGAYISNTSDKLKSELNKISQIFFQNDYSEISVGATIPFVQIFLNMFPNAQMIVTGAAGIDSQIHSQNEKLKISYFKKFVCSLTNLIGDYNQYI
jgi:acetylornithine deacetylase/succinyl-diaminopimelate desuccinylase-like protein